MLRKIYKLFYIILWIGMLTASQGTSDFIARKRKLEVNSLETGGDKQQCLESSIEFTGTSTQIHNEIMSISGTTTNPPMDKYSINKARTDVVTEKEAVNITDNNSISMNNVIKILRELGHTKDKEIFNDSEFVRMFKKYLEKLDSEQDRETINEVLGILSNYENGLRITCNLIEESKLYFITTSIYIMLQNPSPYNYTNGVFLYMLFCPLFPNLTADSIRTRFKMGFLNLLTTNQIVRVIYSLLKDELSINNEERIELVEMVFGHIDFASELDFSVDQVSTITMAIFSSEVPEVFEQVFLTWKMWGIFGIEQQNAIFNSYCSNVAEGKVYKRETLVMLYLFVLNKDEPNLETWKELKEDIKLKFGKGLGCRCGNAMLKVIVKPYRYKNIIKLIVDTFDNCLLDLPEILNTLNTSNFKKYTKAKFYKHDRKAYYYGKKYKIHVCYVFSKFSQDNINNQESNDNSIALLDKLYFDIKAAKDYFRIFKSIKTKKVLDTFGKEVSNLVSNHNDKVELKNTMGALRQIVQSKNYNYKVFNGLFMMINIGDSRERVYTALLFLLTKENILKDVSKSGIWILHKKDIGKTSLKRKTHNFRYIEEAFMCNVGAESKPEEFKPCTTDTYLRKIHACISDITEKIDGIYRERHLFQRFFFHPKFKKFYEYHMISGYIAGLEVICMVSTEEDYKQLARDLILNNYYYEPTTCERYKLIMKLVDLESMKFLPETAEKFEDKVNIYREREKSILGHYFLQ
ncbi:hypothetical protein PAEPH01_1646 [Pancytospora epiphaga]|nr:hypothetical protein PAEPH01_1646 [Pancytospora epiphaga]